MPAMEVAPGVLEGGLRGLRHDHLGGVELGVGVDSSTLTWDSLALAAESCWLAWSNCSRDLVELRGQLVDTRLDLGHGRLGRGTGPGGEDGQSRRRH